MYSKNCLRSQCKYCDTLLESAASKDYFCGQNDTDESQEEDSVITFPDYTKRKRAVVKLIGLQTERARKVLDLQESSIREFLEQQKKSEKMAPFPPHRGGGDQAYSVMTAEALPTHPRKRIRKQAKTPKMTSRTSKSRLPLFKRKLKALLNYILKDIESSRISISEKIVESGQGLFTDHFLNTILPIALLLILIALPFLAVSYFVRFCIPFWNFHSKSMWAAFSFEEWSVFIPPNPFAGELQNLSALWSRNLPPNPFTEDAINYLTTEVWSKVTFWIVSPFTYLSNQSRLLLGSLLDVLYKQEEQ